MIIDKDDWYKGAARELSYFTTNEIIHAYSNMNKKYGHAFYNVLFYTKDGILTMIRKQSELKEILDYIESLSEDFIINELKTTALLFDELVILLEKFKLTKDSWKQLQSLCRNLWTYNMFCIYFGYAAERQKIHNIKMKNYSLVVKVRNELNDLSILESFLKNYFSNLDLTTLSFEEIGLYLETNFLPSTSILNQRQLKSLIFMENLIPKQIPLSKIDLTLSKYLITKDYSKDKTVQGKLVFDGNIVGIARIIKKQKDLDQIKPDEIIVTIMTSPEYVPYLSKVKGIVTDYGGATCHAAIIARELKIPCIVGTKVATTIFKNGDLLKFNSKTATVTKISS